MNEPFLITAAVLLLIVILGITGEALYKYLTRERGPWVVTRVSADGSGGLEFLYMISGVYDLWSKDPDKALVYLNKEWAELQAGDVADVAPLSKYTGVK